MTREEKLTTMRSKDLIDLAISLGVKVNTNTAKTSLKEARAKVIAKIIAAEGKSPADESIEAEIHQQPENFEDYTQDMGFIKKLVETSNIGGSDIKAGFTAILTGLPDAVGVKVEPMIEGAYKVVGKKITCVAVPFVGGFGIVYPTSCETVSPDMILDWAKSL